MYRCLWPFPILTSHVMRKMHITRVVRRRSATKLIASSLRKSKVNQKIQNKIVQSRCLHYIHSNFSRYDENGTEKSRRENLVSYAEIAHLRDVAKISAVSRKLCMCTAQLWATWYDEWGWYNFRNGTAERDNCFSFRILQGYDNTERNSGTHCDWPERNPNPIPMPNLTLTLTLTLTLCLTLP